MSLPEARPPQGPSERPESGPRPGNRGLFIVLEGIDGAGTTTQSFRLAQEIERRGRQVVVTREPSPGPVGRFLRSVIEGREARLDEPTMALLFAADRLDHLARDILPALKQGTDVISDRYYHSSLAYQGSATDPAWVRMLNDRALAPDVTYVLDLPVEVAMLRRRARNDDLELYDDQAVQQRVAELYQRLDELLPGELLVRIDGAQEQGAVTTALLADLERRGWL